MSESYLPIPDPPTQVKPMGQHRCPECGVLVQAVQPSPDGRGWKGWCPSHDWVRTATRRTSVRRPE